MKAALVPIDSALLGRNVLAIEDFAVEADFAAFERQYVGEHAPFYVSCKVPLERVVAVHLLEQHGFRLIECQIRSQVDLLKPLDVPPSPYQFARVTTEEQLAAVMDIAGTTFAHDRFSIDPEIPRGASGDRYRRYVRRSFEDPAEAVYRLFDPATDRTVAFKTHRHLPDGEALLLLGGVHPDFVRVGVGVMNTYGELQELRRLGLRRATTHISAANYPVVNLELVKLGFRVVTVFAVMRKIYA